MDVVVAVFYQLQKGKKSEPMLQSYVGTLCCRGLFEEASRQRGDTSQRTGL